MTWQDSELPTDPIDEAVARRLGKLRTMPVDTSKLDGRLLAAIPRRQNATIYHRLRRPLAAVAASITVGVIIAATVLLSSSSGEVLASPAQMAQVHRDIVSNALPVTRVNSIEEASKVLSQQSGAQSPQLPEAPQAHVMACCMKSIRNKRIACVLMQDQAGTPITMTVARSSDMRMPHGRSLERNGVMYQAQAVGELNMVMTERAGRYVCLMSQLSQDQLVDLVTRLQF